MICYAAEFSPAWILVTTWQLTIFASIFILAIFGNKLTKMTIFSTVLVLAGITIVNFSHFNTSDISTVLYSSIPVIIASFAFPLGNQLVWQEKKKRDVSILNNAFAKVFLLTLGSSPLWLVLFIFLDVGTPSITQLKNVAIQLANLAIQLANSTIQLTHLAIQLTNLAIQLTNSAIQLTNLAIQLANSAKKKFLES